MRNAAPDHREDLALADGSGRRGHAVRERPSMAALYLMNALSGDKAVALMLASDYRAIAAMSP